MNERSAVVLDTDSDNLVIHIERAGFAEFVKGLLGQPQTIENIYSGAFDISKNEIENVYHLVEQRVTQQNKAHLIQFSIKIFYSDDSSVLLNSLADFQNYRDVRPRVSIAANLTWSYLIQFEDRNQPERQIIELLIRTGEIVDTNEEVFISRRVRAFARGFKLNIEHTARTWASDIENLLSHQIRSWVITEPWIKRVIYNNSGWIGLIAGLLFLGLTFTGLVLASTSIEDGLRQAIGQASTLSIDGKLDYLMQSIVDARMQGPEKYILIGAVITSFLAVFVGGFVGMLADNPPNSYLVISENAAAKRIQSLKKRRRGWQYFFCSGVTTTIAGFLSKYLFLIIVGKSVL